MSDMNGDLCFMWMLIEERQGRVWREAEIDRLLRDSRPERSGLRARLVVRAGDGLIALGSKLKARYRIVNEPAYATMSR